MGWVAIVVISFGDRCVCVMMMCLRKRWGSTFAVEVVEEMGLLYCVVCVLQVVWLGRRL